MAPRCACAAVCAGLGLICGLFLFFRCPGGAGTGAAVCLSAVAGLVPLWLRRRDGGTERRVCVLVLGDIGRSPRMQYHALSLSKHGYEVTFVGFVGEIKPHPDVLREEKIKILPIAEVRGVRVGPKILTYVTKVMTQCLQLLFVLLRMELQSFILMQNPPGLPGIAVAWFVCVLRGSRFIIDWHNYGYTIMSLSLGLKHPVVRLAKWYEHFFGPLATHNLCVTNAMKDDLQKNWGIRATTLYDRPASVFRETPLKQQHQLFRRLSVCVFRADVKDVEQTAFSVRHVDDDSVTLRTDRPALLISSTSWTGERKHWSCDTHTGKGPQKEHYRKLIDSLRFQHVQICTPWLEAQDYPVRQTSGVCLHMSSSGLDLPMKVVDMFGCCLPVCAINFNCLHELVQTRGERSPFLSCFCPVSVLFLSDGRLGSFRRNLRASRGQRWDDNWDQNVLPLIRRCDRL
uniref:ALG1 chitobiosyldiphosphodolichol beta-mannosyltransferase n=1 Tax=Sphaeramia orbicularis TaxID=375764 RepID=A0A672YKD2_9TELE